MSSSNDRINETLATVVLWIAQTVLIGVLVWFVVIVPLFGPRQTAPPSLPVLIPTPSPTPRVSVCMAGRIHYGPGGRPLYVCLGTPAKWKRVEGWDDDTVGAEGTNPALVPSQGDFSKDTTLTPGIPAAPAPVNPDDPRP